MYKCKYCGEDLKEGQYKFCCQEHDVQYRKDKLVFEWIEGKEVSDERIRGNKCYREFLLKEQECKCAICGIKNEWMEKPIVFILDHIDGNSDNNKRENVRLICPMCDSQTDTYKNRNKGKGREYRRKKDDTL